MPTNAEERIWLYANALKGAMGLDRMLVSAMLVAETKAEYKGRDLTKEGAYEAMLIVADKLQTTNPFKDPLYSTSLIAGFDDAFTILFFAIAGMAAAPIAKLRDRKSVV